MDFVGTYPDKVAAAMALCGGCSLRDVQGLGTLPFWIMHGTADRAVNISESKKVVNALKDADNDRLLRYDWIPGASHGALTRIFYLSQTYEWLFQHDKQRNPNQVDRRISITQSDMDDCYRGLNTHGGQVATVNSLVP